MGWKAFIADVVRSLAWPLVVTLALWIFRDSIQRLVQRLAKLKHKDTEIEFENAIKEIQIDFPVAPRASNQPTAESDTLYRLAEVSPRSAIIEAWRMLESAASQAILKSYPNLDNPRVINTPSLMNLLKGQVLTEKEFRDFNELRRLRNTAAHSEDFDLRGKAVESYIDIALTMADALKNK